MKRELLTILLFLLLTNLSFAQTIQEIFNSLPLEYTPELTTEAKESLIENGTYTFPDLDNRETLKAYYSAKNDYLRLEYYFTTGQNGFIVIELRKFDKKDGSAVVVYSKFGGARRAFDQHSLLTFDYLKGSLNLNDNLGLPKTIATKKFLKSNLPDSLKTEKITFNTSYNLTPEELNSVGYYIDIISDQYVDWILTDRFLFTWNGQRFEKRKE